MTSAILKGPEAAMVREYGDVNGARVRLTIPAPGDFDSSFVMSVHKAGSVMLNDVVRGLCDASGVPHLSIHDQLFSQGYPIEKASEDMLSVWKQRGYCFFGIRRFMPFFSTPYFRTDPIKILLVRDPRDVATSWYFSARNSHLLPGSGEKRGPLEQNRARAQSVDIDSFTLRGGADGVLNNMESYRGLLGLPRLVVYRYEDIIFDKLPWIEDIAHVLSLTVPAAILETVRAQVDIFPERENPDTHIRQVLPGNYRKHLAPATVAYIENKYRDLFEAFGYARSA